MQSSPAWHKLVDRYLASQVSPLSDFPGGYVAWAYRGLVELHAAVKAEERRKHDETASKKAGPPQSSQRSTTR